MKRSILMACLVLALVAVEACSPQPAPPTLAPTPSATSPAPATATPSPAPTPTPPSTPTAVPTVPPSPSPAVATPASVPTGPLPRLLDQVNLSLPAGNAYEPHHLALDPERGLAYALAADCPGAPLGCIAQVNLHTGTLQRVASLPGTSYSPIAAAGRWVFFTYIGEDSRAHLASLDVEDNRHVVDLVVADPMPEILGLDAASGRLFVRRGSDLEVRNTLDLRVVAQAGLPAGGWQMDFQIDPVAGRAYVATKGAVYGLQASNLAILWTFQEEAWGQFTGLVLETGGTRLYVEAEYGVLALDPLSGAVLEEVPWQAEGQAPWRWSLVAADATGDWLCLHRRDGARTWLELVRASTGERLASLPLWGGEEAFAYDPEAGQLAALRRESHEIALFRVGAQGLVLEGTVATGIEVHDLLLDPEASRVYVTDSHGQLHVFQMDEDWAHLDPVATLEGRGLLTLDSQHGRLYVAQDPGPVTHIYDTRSLERIGGVAMGGAIAVDPDHGRWFLGHEVLSLPEENLYPTVQVFAWNAEGTAFEEVARIPQPGMPVYNPLRDELYIVNDTAHVVDPATWQVVGELLPGFTSPSIRRCNGCRIISDVTVLPERDLLLVHVWPISAGKGAGFYPNPIALRANTLDPITPTATILSSACGAFGGSMPGRRAERLVVVADPVAGRTYENRIYSRYVSFHNVWVYQDSQVVSWLDGQAFALVDPVYQHALAPVGDRFLVLDLESMTPLGEIPRTCIQAADFGRGRWLASLGPEVQVYSLAGAEPPAPPPPKPTPLPKNLTALHPSPDFGRDQTLFAVGGGRIYRSRDGGDTWEWLRGGLPEGLAGPSLSVALALSPAFGRDGTLFAALREGDWLGLGIYRSTDGGDTWHPAWRGLQALRVERIVPSPQFPEDGRVAAYARYEQLGDPFEGGEVLYLSSDGGRTWEEVGRHVEGVAGARELPDLATLLPLEPPRLQCRVGLGAKAVECSRDGGATWSTAVTVPEELGWVQSVVVSPDMETDPAVFAFTSRRVLGSADAGATWQVAVEEALAPKEGTSWWPVAAYIPAGQGGPRLLVAPGEGTLLRLDPWALTWEPLTGHTPTPSPPPPPTGTPTPCALPVERFAALYARHQEALGCPLEAEQATWAAWQPFERGAMLWLEQTREIWVLEDDGHWERFADTWTEGQPESDPNLVPPPGLLQPIRGFGKVWRELLGGPAAAVGWALAPEQGRQTIWQPFQGGWIFEPEGIQPLVVLADGRWSQE